MVQLLSHGAAGTWLLTDTDATARQTQGAAQLGDELKMFPTTFEARHSSWSSYGNSENHFYNFDEHTSPNIPNNLHHGY